MKKLSDYHINPSNPRLIKDERFKKLCKSIEEFPKMMALRPIIVDAFNMILGGNMRYKALKELGYKEVPNEWIRKAEELTEDEVRRFIVEDNVPFGEWDWDRLLARLVADGVLATDVVIEGVRGPQLALTATLHELEEHS